MTERVRRDLRCLGAYLAALLVGLLLVHWLTPDPDRITTPTRSDPRIMVDTPLAPCLNEDGPGPCFWDAQTRGNGQGTSFIMDADGTIHPTD